MKQNDYLKQNIYAFLEKLKSDNIISYISKFTTLSQNEIKHSLNSYLNETYVGLDLFCKYYNNESKVLEVGSGIFALSYYLRSQGINITALEPTSNGFDFIKIASTAIRSECSNIDLPILDIGIEDLNTATTEKYDFIFSVHVLEHVNNPINALEIIDNQLNTEGVSAHICPNYNIPYDPHFGIPLIPFFPKLTEKIFFNKIKDNIALWNSLNFITYNKIKKIAKIKKLNLNAEKGGLYNALLRLEKDSYFSKRHSNLLIRCIYNMLKYSRAMYIIKYLPPSYDSPLTFKLSKKITNIK